MIPPITNALIADTIQTRNMVAAGQSYWMQGRVSGLEISPEMALIIAEVEGNARLPYEVTIIFPEDDGSGPLVECTCPVGFDCKHGAAVLFAAQAQLASATGAASHALSAVSLLPDRPVPLPQALQQWVIETQTETLAAQRGTFPLVYVFVPYLLHDGKSRKGKALSSQLQELPQRLVVQAWVWGTDTRRNGPPKWWQPSAYDLREGRLALDPVDHWLVRRMSSYGGDFDTSGSPKGVAGSDWIERVVETGRARWRKPDGPALSWGNDTQLQWHWLTLANEGLQRLVLGDLREDQTLLATTPPILIDEETGVMHRVQCDTDPVQAQRLLQLPPIPPEAVSQIAQRWPELAGPKVPAPSLAQLQELGQIRPVPVLTLVQEKVEAYLPKRRGNYSSWASSTQKRDMAIARLSFDYAGYQVTSAANSASIIASGESGFFRFSRDISAERAALEQLFQRGLIPLDAFQELKTKPAQLWDFAPHAAACVTDFAPFLQNQLPQLRAQGWRIEYAPKWRLTITEICEDDLTFEVNPTRTDWFDISLGARIDGKVVDILPILRQMLAAGGTEWLEQLEGSVTIAIGPNKLAQLPTENIKPVLKMLLAMALDAREAASRLHLPRSDLSILVDLETASGTRIGWRGGESLRRLARALTRIETEETATPIGFKAALRPYQQKGLDWLQALHSAGFGGVLADDMGLGKTVQALAHVITLKAAGKLGSPVLIVCPTSVLPNWQAEITRFAPELAMLLWHGSTRLSQSDKLANADVILTSYPVLLRDHKLFAGLRFALILFDEAQVLKNPKTAGFRVARSLKAEQVIALSGTPVENQLTDIWSLMELVTPNLLGTLDQFRRTIDKPIVRDDDATAKALLQRRLRPFLLRRTKDEVARDLPKKTIISEWIELEKAQLANYESLRLLMQQRVRDEIARVGLLRSQIVFLDALLKLRQACCDPRLVSQFEDKGCGSAKLARLLEMLPELLREGRRIILFSQFTSMLDLIKPELDALAIPYVEIRGETRDRETPVRQFQEGDVPLILVSLKAGGTGLNLTAADTIILYDPWWNPAVEAQAIDRAHRIGQSKPVFVHRLIARGTIEEKILTLQEKKRALASMLWEGDVATPAKLTEEDVAFLLG